MAALFRSYGAEGHLLGVFVFSVFWLEYVSPVYIVIEGLSVMRRLNSYRTISCALSDSHSLAEAALQYQVARLYELLKYYEFSPSTVDKKA